MIDPHEFGENIRTAIGKIANFVHTDEFDALMREFASVPKEDRELFIRSVIINPDALAERGIQVPEDLVIQRSSFEDGRPTLFCVTKYLPDGNEKVTITFDEGWEKEYFSTGTVERINEET